MSRVQGHFTAPAKRLRADPRKMFGVGLGLAILIDVLIVRMVIAPAVLTLLGDRAWWLPAWLDRTLPNISLEGSRKTVDAEPEREKVPV